MANFGQNQTTPYTTGKVASILAGTYGGYNDLAVPVGGPQGNATFSPTGGPALPPLPPSIATPTGTGGTAPTGTAPTGTGGTAPTGTTPGAPSATPALDYNAAFDNFKDFIGYDFAFDEMMRALNHGYAASGQLQSGAAAKGIAEHAANLAQQGAAFPYLNYLTGQQNMGAGAASSLAGVGQNFGSAAQTGGQNYANAAGSINASMGNAIGSGAANLGNLALANGQNQAAMWNQVGGALGNLGSSFFPTGG